MNPQDVDILELIPQRPPIVMVDRLIFSDETKSITEFTVKDDCILTENGRLTPSGLIENIAQSAAARMGWICKESNQPVPVGFIGQVKDFTAIRLPLAGEVVKTEVTVIADVMAVILIRGEVFSNLTLCASCEMKVFLKKD